MADVTNLPYTATLCCGYLWHIVEHRKAACKLVNFTESSLSLSAHTVGILDLIYQQTDLVSSEVVTGLYSTYIVMITVPLTPDGATGSHHPSRAGHMHCKLQIEICPNGGY